MLLLFLMGISFLAMPPKSLKAWYSRRHQQGLTSEGLVRKAAFIFLGFLVLLVADAMWSNWQATELRQVGYQIEELASAGVARIHLVQGGARVLESALAKLTPAIVLDAIGGPDLKAYLESFQVADSSPSTGLAQLFAELVNPNVMISRGIDSLKTHISEKLIKVKKKAVQDMSQGLDKLLTSFSVQSLRDGGEMVQEALEQEERVRFVSTLVILLLVLTNAVVGSYCIKTRRTRGLLCCCLAFTLLGGGLYLGQAYHVASGVASGAICDYMRSLPSQTTPMAQLNLTGQQVFSMIDQCSRGKDLVAAFHASGVKEIEFKSVKIIAEPTYLEFVTREKVKKSEGDVNGEADHSTGTTEEKIRRLEFDGNGRADYPKLIARFLQENIATVPLEITAKLAPFIEGLTTSRNVLKSFSLELKRVKELLDILNNIVSHSDKVAERIRSAVITAVQEPMMEWLQTTLNCEAMATQALAAVATGCRTSEGVQGLFLDLALLGVLVVLLSMCFFTFPRFCEYKDPSPSARPEQEYLGDDGS